MTLRSPAENEKMTIGGWISTAMTRNTALPQTLRELRFFVVKNPVRTI